MMIFIVILAQIVPPCDYNTLDFDLMNANSPSLAVDDTNLIGYESGFHQKYREILAMVGDIEGNKAEIENAVNVLLHNYEKFSQTKNDYVKERQLGYVTAEVKLHELNLKLADIFEKLKDEPSAEALYRIDEAIFQGTTYYFKHVLQRSRFLQKNEKKENAKAILKKAYDVPYFKNQTYWPNEFLVDRIDVMGELAKVYSNEGKISDSFNVYYDLFLLVSENKTPLPNICKYWYSFNNIRTMYPNHMSPAFHSLMDDLDNTLFDGFRDNPGSLNCADRLQTNAFYFNFDNQRAVSIPDPELLKLEFNCYNFDQIENNFTLYQSRNDQR